MLVKRAFLGIRGTLILDNGRKIKVEFSPNARRFIVRNKVPAAVKALVESVDMSELLEVSGKTPDRLNTAFAGADLEWPGPTPPGGQTETATQG